MSHYYPCLRCRNTKRCDKQGCRGGCVPVCRVCAPHAREKKAGEVVVEVIFPLVVRLPEEMSVAAFNRLKPAARLAVIEADLDSEWHNCGYKLRDADIVVRPAILVDMEED